MSEKQNMQFKEFVALMAMMMALTALAIDAMLPALGQIGGDLGTVDPNDNQLIISVLFLGLGLGQLFYGPLSDSIGRKPTVYFGLFIFGGGTVLSIYAPNLDIMLLGRLLQGIGLSGPRVVSVAIIRDLYKGEKMAQVMSFVMTVFIVVPTIAPFLGQGILNVASWRMIFVVLLVLGVITFIWFSARQQETLEKSKRIPFRFSQLRDALTEILSNNVCLGYTLAAGFISSAFVGFLNSSQQIFQTQFGLGDAFPRYFAVIAISVGLAAFINGKIVIRLGMRKMVGIAVVAISGISLVFFCYMLLVSMQPSLLIFMVYICCTVFFIGILFGNLNSLAMEPLGHIAGVGAAVVGAGSRLISVPFGTWIGMAYDDTVFPLVCGFLIFGLLTWLAVWFGGRRKK